MHNKLQLIFIRIYFVIVSRLFPSLAVVSAHRFFHYPIKNKKTNPNEKALPEAKKFNIKLYNDVILQGYRWGNENHPIVFLVHGWSSTSKSMSHFTDILLKHNYQVISYDAIRHGESSGKLSDLASWADSVHAILDYAGEVECIIAHSFGCAAVTVASKLGLHTKKLIFIAPIHNVDTILKRFGEQLYIPTYILERMKQYTWEYNQQRFETYGKDLEDIFHSKFHVPTLIFHDLEDKEVPIENSKMLCQKWPWVILKKTQGLGHRRILYDETVVNESHAFIRDTLKLD
ncbi:MAG TPA: alpha/beta hydrolase [Epsilonproteobacteria bacterium]|nr:alpha/beta hydrolase [Campylobacterota bacterium]